MIADAFGIIRTLQENVKMDVLLINCSTLYIARWPSFYKKVLYPAAFRGVVQFYTLKEGKFYVEEYFG